MATIIIKDLISGKLLDNRAMTSIRGGLKFGNSLDGSQTQDMTYTPPAPSAFGSGGIQPNNGPDQNPYSFSDLATKHTGYF